MDRLNLPFAGKAKVQARMEEAANVVADAHRLRQEAAAQVRAVQQQTRNIIDLLVFATRVDVLTNDRDYPTRYLLVDEDAAKKAIEAWKADAER